MAGNFREYRSREEMAEKGWKVSSSNSECRNCGAEITWATSPKGKKLPLDANSTSAHFKSCTAANGSSGAGAQPLRNHAQPSSQTASDSAALRESLDECAQAVRELCRLLRARAEAK